MNIYARVFNKILKIQTEQLICTTYFYLRCVYEICLWHCGGKKPMLTVFFYSAPPRFGLVAWCVWSRVPYAALLSLTLSVDQSGLGLTKLFLSAETNGTCHLTWHFILLCGERVFYWGKTWNASEEPIFYLNTRFILCFFCYQPSQLTMYTIT